MNHHNKKSHHNSSASSSKWSRMARKRSTRLTLLVFLFLSLIAFGVFVPVFALLPSLSQSHNDRSLQFNEEARSPFVKKYKTIIHPGEVNRIRELPQNSKIVATHTDSPDVLIWDIEAQPNRHAVLGASNSRPDRSSVSL